MTGKTYIFLLVFAILNNAKAISQNLNEKESVYFKIPFEISSHNNWIFKAVLNQEDSLNLMLHTASDGVTLIQESSSKYPTIQWDQADSIKTWGGDEEAKYSYNNALQIGNFSLDSMVIWENRYSGPGTDGKFGLGLLKNYIIELDFDQRNLMLSHQLPDNISTFKGVEMEYENGFIFIKGKSILKGKEVEQRFLVHSGYGSCILFDDEFAVTNSLSDELEIIDSKILKDAYGNEIKTNEAILPRFEIGEFGLENIPVGFFEGSIGRQKISVLGGDILRRFNMVIDLEHERMYLKPSQLNDLAYTKF